MNAVNMPPQNLVAERACLASQMLDSSSVDVVRQFVCVDDSLNCRTSVIKAESRTTPMSRVFRSGHSNSTTLTATCRSIAFTAARTGIAEFANTSSSSASQRIGSESKGSKARFPMISESPQCPACTSNEFTPIIGESTLQRCRDCGWLVRITSDGSARNAFIFRETSSSEQRRRGPFCSKVNVGGK